MPVGEYTKDQIRQIAEDIGLQVAHKADSQEICFIPDNDYAGFIEREAENVPGPGNFVTADGTVIGRHEGITHYTIGQRKGLNLAMGHPVFVTEIRPETNEVVIGEAGDVFTDSLVCNKLNWMAVDGPARKAHGGKCQDPLQPQGGARVIEEIGEDLVQCRFSEPVRAVTPGQAVVFYDGDYVVGGGIHHPMKKRSVLLGAAAAVMLMTAGCQSKYEKVEVPGTAAETVAQVGTDAAAQAGKNVTGQDAPDQTAGISEKKAERTTESAPTMETRDEIVYVKATTLNLRVSPAPGTEVIAAPANGTALKRTGDNGTWSRVEYEGKTCYAASGYLTTEKPAETAAASGQNAEAGSSASASQSAGEVGLNMDWKYASMSKINSGKAVLYPF